MPSVKDLLTPEYVLCENCGKSIIPIEWNKHRRFCRPVQTEPVPIDPDLYKALRKRIDDSR